jgi:hypothetical protein
MRLPGLSLALAAAWAIAGLLVAGSADARVYDPLTTPKAKYVAPLAPWPAASYRAKDFSLVEWNGKFHLFYTRVRRHSAFHSGSGATEILNETSIGHAVSNDLETWTELDTILPIRPGQWDEHHVWAPSVAISGGTAYLFYGGVRDSQTSISPPIWIPRFQKIGMAMSTDADLQIWFRWAAPIYQPCADGGFPGVPWSTCMPYSFVGTADFRDPFVLPPDPASGSSDFQLFFTARPRMDQFNYVVGLAQAATPLAGGWSDGGALWDTHFPPVNSKVESPHVFRSDGKHHLFFSGDDGPNGIFWMTSDASALGPWTNRGTLRQIFGTQVKDEPYSFPLEVENWFASEHLRRTTPSRTVDYFCAAHAYDAPAEYNPPVGLPEDITTIEFREMLWQEDGSFTFATPNPVRTMAWSHASARPGSTQQLRLTSEGVAGRSADLAVSIIRSGVEIPLAPGSVGLPQSVVLNDGVTEIPWVVPTFGAWLPLDFKVRLTSQPLAAAATFRIVTWGEPNGGEIGTEVPPPIVRTVGGDIETSEPTAAIAPRELALRRLPGSGSGAGHGLALDLPEAAHARLEMFDVRGRLVRVLLDASQPAGTAIARWDGRDDVGRTAPRGIYFARLMTRFGERSLRLLHLGG